MSLSLLAGSFFFKLGVWMGLASFCFARVSDGFRSLFWWFFACCSFLASFLCVCVFWVVFFAVLLHVFFSLLPVAKPVP